MLRLGRRRRSGSRLGKSCRLSRCRCMVYGEVDLLVRERGMSFVWRWRLSCFAVQLVWIVAFVERVSSR